jgi:hypothetical protein
MAAHIFTIVPSFVLTNPRSIRLTVVLSQSDFDATRSWEIPRFSLSVLNACPKAFSGPRCG